VRWRFRGLDQLGFRVLIGRQTMRGHFTVDPDRSFLAGRPPREVRRANRRWRRPDNGTDDQGRDLVPGP
jgi:hypothetical protein